MKSSEDTRKEDFSFPNRIGKYIVESKVSTESFYTIFIVKNSEEMSNNKYFCKMYSRKRLIEDGKMVMFERKIQIQTKLRNNYIIRVFDVIFDSSFIYTITEYCPNGELYDYIISKKALEEDEAKVLFKGIVKGIAYLHKNNIAHRDVKPENILLDSSNNPKIRNFWLSNHINGDNLLKTPCGSLFYAAPEVISGLKYDGKKSDIWNLGVLLYTMVTGLLPWKETTNTILLIKEIINAEYIIPRTVSPCLSQLITSLLNKNPKARPSAQQILKSPWFNDMEQQTSLQKKPFMKAIIIKPKTLTTSSSPKKLSFSSSILPIYRKRSRPQQHQ